MDPVSAKYIGAGLAAIGMGIAAIGVGGIHEKDITLAMARPGGWTIDMSRFARENRTPQDYLSSSYYRIWLAALETLMAERGLVGSTFVVGPEARQPRGGLGPDLAIADRAEQRQRRLGAVGRADCQAGPLGPFLGRPDSNRQLFGLADLRQRGAQLREVVHRKMNPQQHGEQRQLVVVVHLDFGDVRALAGDVVDDGVHETDIVGADSGDDDGDH